MAGIAYRHLIQKKIVLRHYLFDSCRSRTGLLCRGLSNRASECLLDADSRLLQQEQHGSAIDLSYPTYMVWGANTGVGKTLVSTGLATSILRSEESALKDQTDRLERVSFQGCSDKEMSRLSAKNVLYVKPFQTGFPRDSDARFVAQKVSEFGKMHYGGLTQELIVSNLSVHASAAAQAAVCASKGEYEGIYSEEHGRRDLSASSLDCKTLWSWCNAVSPHLAVSMEGGAVGDKYAVDSLRETLWNFNKNYEAKATVDKPFPQSFRTWGIVETAGGVASPGPSGAPQCDLYRPLRLPGLLVGDGKLGGISCTISAYESLLLRGYDTIAIVLIDFGLGNAQHLRSYLQDKVPILQLSPLPKLSSDLTNWFQQSFETFTKLQKLLEQAFVGRLQRLEEMPKKASQILWWPFTQHSFVLEKNVTVIDSRCGPHFATYKGYMASEKEKIVQQFDACASWWTQGPDPQLQQEIAREVAYTAGRYGHVMFPENVHEPALKCAELLLEGVGKGWADRVYYSDNGSTSIEIALKMAFRRFSLDHGLLYGQRSSVGLKGENLQFKVLALKGSYHGDTLGAMEAQASSPYTGFFQQPWYSGRGFFLDPPTVFCKDGHWHLHLPNILNVFCGADMKKGWKSRDYIFAKDRDGSKLAMLYLNSIGDFLSRLVAEQPDVHTAALIIEPVIHGAGGMHIVDPLYQRVLVQECKRRKIPVIFDEVFAGCWRLGAESAAEILGCVPDIACYAKLLTGGVVPLAATLSQEKFFQAFEGSSKLDALLHGHSFTAHPIGCSAAIKALKYYKNPSKNSNFLPSKARLKELWDQDLVADISAHPIVERIISLGTVFALELHATHAESGYSSMLASNLIERLKSDGIYARPLGNVVYLMCGPMTSVTCCTDLLQRLFSHLKVF
ncbi:hypothetical protein O6H91_Y261100 [Diphasiastrum complanatum]|nr:hypothetical protein O6H91_Y261100 [Diphasiastrum complanatum]